MEATAAVTRATQASCGRAAPMGRGERVHRLRGNHFNPRGRHGRRRRRGPQSEGEGQQVLHQLILCFGRQSVERIRDQPLAQFQAASACQLLPLQKNPTPIPAPIPTLPDCKVSRRPPKQTDRQTGTMAGISSFRFAFQRGKNLRFGGDLVNRSLQFNYYLDAPLHPSVALRPGNVIYKTNPADMTDFYIFSIPLPRNGRHARTLCVHLRVFKRNAPDT